MKQMIPYFHNSREFRYIKTKFQNHAESVLKSGKFLQGKYTELIEYKLAKKLNVKYCITCNSCTDATYFALSYFKESRQKFDYYKSNTKEINEILEEGKLSAGKIAKISLNEIKHKLGITS